ncbi:Flp pilus assembly protein CpaB [Falsiroseomonas sp. E2-1-a4]|uniref:Flp pilus assembly protein CpaB n=1 Tax=Falsiroseomonas sp. E2-1-a4 TaxID=3239299 RepID=UPI003F305938
MPLRIIVAVILLATSGGLGWLAFQALNPGTAVAVEPRVVPVRLLVAAQSLRTGVLLKDSDLRERDVPPDQVPEGAILAGEDALPEVRGAMLRRYLDAGDPLVRADVLRPRDRGFLAAVLTPGARAVSIGVDARTGASGLISPGDIVDVILTQEFQRGDTPAGRRVVAETVLTSIRVIAVDQQFAQGATTPPAPGGAGSPNRVARTVTLQVTPEQSERVAVAERLGRLLLAVRSIEAEEGDARTARSAAEGEAPDGAIPLTPRNNPVIFGSDVSSALARDEPSAMPRMRVIQGNTRSDVIFR